MTYQESIEQASFKLDEVAKLAAGTDVEAKQRIPILLKEVEQHKADAAAFQSVEEQRSAILNLASGASGGSSVPTPRGKGFKNMGEFLYAVGKAHQGADERLLRFNDKNESVETKDMTGQSGAGGGFLVPVEQYTNLMSVVSERSFIRQRASIIPMTRRQVNIPVLDQTATTAGQPHWFGGLQAYWTEEASLKLNTDPKFRQVVLTAWKLIMYTRASDELLDDSAVSLAAFLSGQMGFAGAIQWMEEYAFLNGSGAGMPLGVLNSGALIKPNRGTTSTIVYTDLTNMLKRFLPNSKGVWVVSQSAMQQLLELNGPSGNPAYLWASAVNGAPGTLLGYPVIFTEKAPILGQVGDIALIDWSYYLIGDRQATTIESTRYDNWRYDETSWRAVHRVDGRPWLNTVLTYQDGTTQVSPFVALNNN